MELAKGVMEGQASGAEPGAPNLGEHKGEQVLRRRYSARLRFGSWRTFVK